MENEQEPDNRDQIVLFVGGLILIIALVAWGAALAYSTTIQDREVPAIHLEPSP